MAGGRRGDAVPVTGPGVTAGPSSPSLRTRLRVLLAVVLPVVVTASVLAGTSVAELRRAQADQARLAPAAAEASRLATLLVDQETAVRGYLLTEDPLFLEPYLEAAPLVPRELARLRVRLAGFPALLAEADAVEQAHREWVAGSAEPAIAQVQAGEERSPARIRADRRLFRDLRAETDDLVLGIVTESSAATEAVGQAVQRLLGVLATAGVLGVVLVLGTAAALRRWVLRPVETLASSVRRVAVDTEPSGPGRARARDAGGPDAAAPGAGVTIAAGGPEELAGLGRDVEAMRDRLVSALARTERAVQALRQSGPAVVALRDALAPRGDRVPGVAVAGRLEPAEGVLAGDWYDVLALPGGRAAVVVGDVAGHGPAAGVFALRLKHLLGAALDDDLDPGDALAWVADRTGETDELFATVVVAVVDPVRSLLSYASAGHPDLVVVGPAGLQRLPATGPLLSGLVSGWTTVEVPLPPGALVVAHTDGLSEARGPGGQEYGEARLHALLARHAGDDPEAVGDALVADVRRHAAGRAQDDRTVVVLRPAPSGAPRVRPGATAPAAGAPRHDEHDAAGREGRAAPTGDGTRDGGDGTRDGDGGATGTGDPAVSGRRMRDSNSRGVAPNTLSKRAP